MKSDRKGSSFVVERRCAVERSAWVDRVAELYGVGVLAESVERFDVDVSPIGEKWTVGLVSGPSGSGKSSLARALWPECVYEAGAWPRATAVIECLGAATVEAAASALISVGFSSPPAWVRPFRTLSTGEQARVELARALVVGAGPGGVVVFDEFTSVVDRVVARVCAAAVARAVRCWPGGRRFVAVTCHGDVAEWLCADWHLDMGKGSFEKVRLRREGLRVVVRRGEQKEWEGFRRFHYLTGSLSRGSRVYVGEIERRAVCFAAVVPMFGHAGRWRVHRLVVRPEFQGLGVGGRFLDVVARDVKRGGKRVSITTGHPAVVRHCERSGAWQWRAAYPGGTGEEAGEDAAYRGSGGRPVVSLEYVGR